MKKILNSKWMPWNSWLTIAIVIIAPMMYVLIASTSRSKEVTHEMGIRELPNGSRIYTVAVRGCEYIVIEKHNGIGISPVGIPNRLPADDIFNIPKNIK